MTNRETQINPEKQLKVIEVIVCYVCLRFLDLFGSYLSLCAKVCTTFTENTDLLNNIELSNKKRLRVWESQISANGQGSVYRIHSIQLAANQPKVNPVTIVRLDNGIVMTALCEGTRL
jgi:hypothetical protein